MASSSKRLIDLDARVVEEAARTIEGVAFAEVRLAGDRPVLNIVVGAGTHAEEAAGLVQVMLSERFGVAIADAELHVTGVATSPTAYSDEMRVIDLGETTWATEELPAAASTMPADAGRRSGDIDVESVSVTRGRVSLDVRVSLIVGGTPARGSATAGANDAGLRRAVAEATLRALETADSAAHYELEAAAMVLMPESCALVVVSRGESRSAGAAIAGSDPTPALVRATLNAIAAL